MSKLYKMIRDDGVDIYSVDAKQINITYRRIKKNEIVLFLTKPKLYVIKYDSYFEAFKVMATLALANNKIILVYCGDSLGHIKFENLWYSLFEIIFQFHDGYINFNDIVLFLGKLKPLPTYQRKDNRFIVTKGLYKNKIVFIYCGYSGVGPKFEDLWEEI